VVHFVAHDNNLHIDYDGWRGIADPNASGGSYRVHRGDSPNSASNDATFVFSGESISWVYVMGPVMGRARVYVDHIFQADYCLYAPDLQYDAALTFDELGQGKHKLLIQALGETCGGSDSNVSVDYFVTPGGVIESTAPEIRWGSWKTKLQALARQGIYHISRAAGAGVKVRFSGNSVRIMTLRGPKFGKMVVTIDGVTVETVDLHADTASRANARYNNLGEGTHEMVLQNVGAPTKRMPVDGFRGYMLIAPVLEED
jgi:hypothetical protein